MKDQQSYRGHRVELFPQRQNDGTWLCRVKIDGDWIEHDERGIIKVDVQKRALDAAKKCIDLTERLEGN